MIISAYKRVPVSIAFIKHLQTSRMEHIKDGGGEGGLLAQNLRKHRSTWHGRHGSRNLMQAAHTTFVARKQKDNRKWSQSIKPESFTPVIYFLQLGSTS